MDNFDLKKYLTEGKLYEEANPIWVIDAFDDSADIEKAGPAYKKAVIDIIKSKHPDISDKDLEASIEVMNVTWYNASRRNSKGSEPREMKVSAEDFADDAMEHYEDVIVFDNSLAEGKLLKEDVSPRFIKKYLSMGAPEVFEDIEDIESYSDRDKAILIFLDEEHGVTISDKLAKGIKGKAPADIIKYFQDEDYEYMSYSVMKRQLGVPVVTSLTWDETGGPIGADSAFYYSTKHKRKLNKIWRIKYPELDIPKWNENFDNYDTRKKVAQEIEDYYRDQARKQKGVDLEVPYEEYADMYVQALKDEGAI